MITVYVFLLPLGIKDFSMNPKVLSSLYKNQRFFPFLPLLPDSVKNHYEK